MAMRAGMTPPMMRRMQLRNSEDAVSVPNSSDGCHGIRAENKMGRFGE